MYTLIHNNNGQRKAIIGLPNSLIEARKKIPEMLTPEEKKREGVWEIWRNWLLEDAKLIEPILTQE
ncbi:MAG TPA: hypothetical protein VMV56_07525 [Williamwhitmania sp.]|nr:hypothetical protein [Williamwhitmania sp.]